jgi:hypothetical protein
METSMTHTVTRYRRLAGPLAALLCSGLLLGACGGSDDTARKGGAAEQPDATAAARCMREQGIDIPDPQGGQGLLKLELPEDVTEAQLRTAQKTCQDKMPKLPGQDESDPRQMAEMHDQAIRFAACMRDQGLDYPDPVIENGRLLIRTSRLAPGDPAMEKATDACRDHLPTPPGEK